MNVNPMGPATECEVAICEHGNVPLYCLPCMIADKIDSVRLAERERCAKIADSMGSVMYHSSPAFDEACRAIAEKIRSGE